MWTSESRSRGVMRSTVAGMDGATRTLGLELKGDAPGYLKVRYLSEYISVVLASNIQRSQVGSRTVWNTAC